MKTRPASRSRYLTIAASFAISRMACAQDGGLDTNFTPFPDVGGIPNTAVQQPDGSILVAGQFSELGATFEGPKERRYGVARYHKAGNLDLSYAPNINAVAYNVLVQPDSSAFVTGAFDKVNFSYVGDPNTKTRYRLAKFDKAGVTDPLYAPALGPIESFFSLSAVQQNRLLISGKRGYYMLEADGTGVVLDTPNFYSYVIPIQYQGYSVYGTVVRPDQKFFAYGSYGLMTNYGVNSVFIDLLGATGRFNVLGPAGQDSQPYNITGGSSVSHAIHASVLLPDGNLLVGGIFSSPVNAFAKLITAKGATAQEYAGRVGKFSIPTIPDLHALDPQGRPFIDGNVEAIALQTDGKILIGGGFTRVRTQVKLSNGQWRYDPHYGIARLHADGTLDTTFDAKIQPVGTEGWRVLGISIQDDGKILITGTFQRIGPSATNFTYRPLIARLLNASNPPTSSLTTDGNSITWLRGGAGPEATEVIFEWRPANSSVWQLADGIGIGVRTTGGWRRNMTTAILPFSYVRASARTTGGKYNGSSGMVSQTVAYQVQKLGLRRDASTYLGHNSTTDLGVTGIGTPRDVTFTITNVGSATLGAIDASIVGPNYADFSVISPPGTTVGIGGSTEMEVRFNPTTAGAKTATLVIRSNDPEIPSYEVQLTGTALTALEQFRLEYFETTSNAGRAADDADPDGDGLTNYFEFVAGLSPTDKTSIFESVVDRTSGNTKVVYGPCFFDRTYELWTTTSLASGDWVLADSSLGTTTTIGTQRTFTESGPPNQKRFYRVKIIRP